jgi:hypothetical protein
MTQPERRGEPRVLPAAVLQARVRPGNRLVVIDVSASGALVEAGRPLRPGAWVELHLEADAGRASVRACVQRCVVAAITSESGVTYRAALSFHETSDWIRERATHLESGVPIRDGRGDAETERSTK